MRLRKQNKWTRRLKKVATPTVAAGALAGTTVLTTVIAGGKDALAAGPEAVQGFANVVKEVGEGLGPVLSNSFSILSSLSRCKGFEVHYR